MCLSEYTNNILFRWGLKFIENKYNFTLCTKSIRSRMYLIFMRTPSWKCCFKFDPFKSLFLDQFLGLGHQ